MLFRSNIDLKGVEQKAVARAKISSNEMAALNANTVSLTDAENESVQLNALRIYDRISKERNSVLLDYYSAKNNEFIASTFFQDTKIGSIGLFTPFIRDVGLTKTEVFEIAKNPAVYMIDCYVEGVGEDFDTIDNTYKIVGGNTFIESGYSGSGIRVGLIENCHPDKSKMGSDSNNIIYANRGEVNDHATRTSGIIKKFAPSCSIYSYAVDSASVADICNNLIKNYSLHVINMSWGQIDDGGYTSISNEIDCLIRNTRVPVVVAAGNRQSMGTGGYSYYVNTYGISGNAITVGSAITNGTNPDASGAFKFSETSCYVENTPINKPDLCAPGYVNIYSLGEAGGTSYAAPHVTGTIVQMIARNSAFANQPQRIKAALLASATRNCGTSMSYIGKEISNQEGAGVLDADFCYRVSRAGRAAQFDVTSSLTSSNPIKQQVYCDYVTKPFRIACTWEVAATKPFSSIKISDYDMKVYKNGVQVASSTISVGPDNVKGTNCEIIEISPSELSKYGSGYYEVRIFPYGSFHGTGIVRIGLAWEQD